tara:strand:- start:164 stop:304 length:141 start_codon:yes stop_codon:yes gene_type:complete
MINIRYRGRVIYKDLSHEECAEILDEMSEKVYDGTVDPTEIELEEC